MFDPIPYEPSLSDPTFQVPILSDPDSLTSFDLSNLEKNIFSHDVPTTIRNGPADDQDAVEESEADETASMRDSHCHDDSVFPPASLTITTEQPMTRESFKIEGPLTPPIPVPVAKS